MKVILISTFFNPEVGGVESQVESIYRELKKKGVDVSVFTTDASHGESNRVYINQEISEDIFRFRYLIGFGKFFRFAPGLLFKLLFSKYDVIHVHNLHEAHFFGAIFAKLIKRKKLIITGHNPFHVQKNTRKSHVRIGVSFYDFLMRFFLKFINRYIALLESEREFVVTKLGIKDRKVVVIPNGIDDLFFIKYENIQQKREEFFAKHNIDPTKWSLIVGTVSRLEYVKGLQNLKKSTEDHKDVLFLFFGADAGYYQELRKLYGQSRNVLFNNNYLSRTEMVQFYNALDLFLMPSIHESFGLTFVEAMSQGKFVMVTENGGPKEILDNQSEFLGFTIDPAKHNYWSVAIEQYKANSETFSKYSDQRKEFAKKYRWKNIIEQLLEVYSV